ncbi:hypothetical protein ACP70R_039704 [Stipagrostis hirtigluma subsp. patula]
MVVLRPDMSEEERLALTQRYEESFSVEKLEEGGPEHFVLSLSLVPSEELKESNDQDDSVVDLLFQPEKLFISKSALQLLKLVLEALKQDACLSSARVAKEFCYAARDVLLLYKAIVPVQDTSNKLTSLRDEALAGLLQVPCFL